MVKMNVDSLSRAESKRLKKIRETKQRRVAKRLLEEELSERLTYQGVQSGVLIDQ